jgi:hypothetical protein
MIQHAQKTFDHRPIAGSKLKVFEPLSTSWIE